MQCIVYYTHKITKGVYGMYTVSYNGTEYACKGVQEVARLYSELNIDKALVCGQIASIRMTSCTMTKKEVEEWANASK